MLKKLFLIVICSLCCCFFACSKKTTEAPIGKYVLFAKTLNILPKTTSPRQYRIELDGLKDEGIIMGIDKSEVFHVEPFFEMCSKSHYFEKPFLPKAFVIAISLDKRGEMKEYGTVFDLKNFQIDHQKMAISFDAVSAQEISPWILAKQSKLLSFEFFFEVEKP